MPIEATRKMTWREAVGREGGGRCGMLVVVTMNSTYIFDVDKFWTKVRQTSWTHRRKFEVEWGTPAIPIGVTISGDPRTRTTPPIGKPLYIDFRKDGAIYAPFDSTWRTSPVVDAYWLGEGH